MAASRPEKVVFLDRSKASRVEVLEFVAELERSDQLSEVLVVVRDTAGNYSFVGATDDVVEDPARLLGQIELLKQVIMMHALS